MSGSRTFDQPRTPRERLVDIWLRLRRTPPTRLPGKAGRYVYRVARHRLRRWAVQRASGDLSDTQFLRALGGRFPNVESALHHFRTRATPRFFVTAVEARSRAAALADAYPHLAERTRAAAERVLRHEIDLLSSGPTPLPDPLPWHTDFKTGYTWPHDFYEDIDYLVWDRHCDVKVPWELSRCHQMVTLGRAYALERDPRYAREFVAMLNSWFDANPWPRGVNWGRAIEVAIRGVNWLWAAALFDAAPEFDDRTRLRLYKGLIQHGRHTLANLEYSDNNGNHYLANGVGLLFLGVLLPEARESAAWRAKGFEIVWGEIVRQVHPDGVDFEKGIGYQGFVLEFWYSTVLLCDLNGIQVPPHVRERLARMFDFVYAYTRPDGTFPQVGDNDDGRLVALDDEPPGSHRRHLGVGGAMLGRPDLLAAAGDSMETALWLCGASVLEQPMAVLDQASQAFPHGGFYVMRERDVVMLFDAGEVGMNGIGAHGHNDMLSFDLWAAGAPLLVDPGTYVYTGDAPARQALRSTAAHNLLRVDGEEIARLGTGHWLWRIENDAHPTVRTWETSPERDVLDAEHDGYTRLPEPVVHRRRVEFDKRRRLFLLDDRLEGRGQHLAELFFHPRPGPLARDGLLVCVSAPEADLWVVPLDAPTGLTLHEDVGWVSRAYGHREPAPVLRYAVRADVPLRLRTALVLVERGTSAAEVRSLLVQDGVPA